MQDLLCGDGWIGIGSFDIRPVAAGCYGFDKIKAEGDWKCKGFSREALDVIRHHRWPGNVREMINRIRRAMVVQDGLINPEDLELSVVETANEKAKLKGIGTELRKKKIEAALKENQCNITRTAKALGISRSYLYMLIKQFGISIEN